MFLLRQILAAAAGVLLLAGAAYAEPFSLTSSSFKDGTPMPLKHAGANKANPNCLGENTSPQLSWSNVPAGTTSYALIMTCLLYTSPSPRDRTRSRMPSSA